jgi:osmoprotectant transport system permease protein
MTLLDALVEFFSDPANWSGSRGIPVRVSEHLLYTFVALAVAFAIAFPVGLVIGHTGRGALLAINIGNAARAVPTFGVLILVVLLAGIGFLPVLVALVIIGIPPILTSTYAGVRGVEGSTVNAARGMGMTEGTMLLRVELPIALPTVIAGLRSATLQVVSTATIAAYVALGGLGRYVIDGLGQRDYGKMAGGAVLVALLAVLLDAMWVLLSRIVVSPGVSGRLKRAQNVSASRSSPAGKA